MPKHLKISTFRVQQKLSMNDTKMQKKQFKDRERKTHQAKKATITPEITLPKTIFETFEACTPNNIWMLKSNLNNTSNSCNLGSKSVAKETTLVKWERMHQHKDTNTNQNYNHNSGCNNTQHLDQVLQLRSCHEQLQVLQIILFNHACNDKDGTKIF